MKIKDLLALIGLGTLITGVAALILKSHGTASDCCTDTEMEEPVAMPQDDSPSSDDVGKKPISLSEIKEQASKTISLKNQKASKVIKKVADNVFHSDFYENLEANEKELDNINDMLLQTQTEEKHE